VQSEAASTSSLDGALAEVILVRDGDLPADVDLVAAEAAAAVPPSCVTTPPYELYGCRIGFRSLASSSSSIGPFCSR